MSLRGESIEFYATRCTDADRPTRVQIRPPGEVRHSRTADTHSQAVSVGSATLLSSGFGKTRPPPLCVLACD
jgi:hypothetical protein